jgi:hypothetical protein
LWYFDGNEWNVRSENGQHLLVDGLWKSKWCTAACLQLKSTYVIK